MANAAPERSARPCVAAERLRLISCVGVDLEAALLPHFLDHYLGLGVPPANVHLVLNSADPDSPGFEAADAMARARGVAPGRRWIAPYTSEAMWAERRAEQAARARPGDWIVNADVDELHRYPAPPAEVAAHLEAHGLGALQGVMIDRLAEDGALAPVRADAPLGAQFPLRADVSLSVIGTGEAHGLAGTVKMMLHGARVEPRRGGHTALGPERAAGYAAGARLSVFGGARDPDWRGAHPFQVDHYKWTAGLTESLSRRLATPGVSVAGREYGGKIDRYLARHGRIRLEDAHLLEEVPPEAPDWRERLARMRRMAIWWRARSAARHRIDGARRLLARMAGR